MRDLKKIYESKLITVDQVLEMIKSGDQIVCGNNAHLPFSFMDRVHEISERVENVRLIHTGLFEELPLMSRPEMKGHFIIEPMFSDGFTFSNHDLQLSSYIPCHMHNGMTSLVSDRTIDYFICGASRMDNCGYFRFSLNNFSETLFAENARKVILEVNPNMPLTNGTNEFPIDMVDYIVEVDRPVLTIPNIPSSEEEMSIGRNVAELVADGSTIQLGIGGIPNAVGLAFRDKNDLGVHTEMITSVMADLMKEGVITGNRKTLHKRKMIGSFALGDQALYDYMDENPSIWLMSGSYVNNREVISQNDNMVSVNTAIQVDLCGQVCSESIGPVQYSGTGGAADFAFGASHSKGGKSIVALRSTAKKGTISTIVPFLIPGSTVSIVRNDIDYIVTEYGVANLRCRSIRERCENLINVAHPKFRDELRQQAKEYRIW